jgi:TPR repeat protein
MKKILITIFTIFTLISTSVLGEDFKFEKFQLEAVKLDRKKQQQLFEKYVQKSAGEKVDVYPYLGYLYYNGIGVEKNIEMGVNIYQRAADEESDLGKYLLGKHLIETGENKDLGLSYIIKSSDSGLSLATLYIAKIYEEGIGFEKDSYYALEYYHRAAKLGSSKAMFFIAKKLLESGQPENYKKGLAYLIDSADLRYEEACDTLQKLYITPNKIIERDSKKHTKYLICSANNDNVSSIKQLAEYYSKGIIVMIDNVNAYKYYSRYVEIIKKPTSKEELNTYYKAGIAFVKVNKYKDSVEILKVASRGNIAEASNSLARLYEFNYLGEPDYDKATLFYTAAQKQGLDTTESLLRIQRNKK